MKSATALFAFVILLCSPFIAAQQQTPEQAAYAIAMSALQDAGKLHIGMTRANVERLFHVEGGIQAASSVRYLYPKCSAIHLDVTYSVKLDAEGRDLSSPDDKILSVSRPYLDYDHVD